MNAGLMVKRYILDMANFMEDYDAGLNPPLTREVIWVMLLMAGLGSSVFFKVWIISWLASERLQDPSKIFADSKSEFWDSKKSKEFYDRVLRENVGDHKNMEKNRHKYLGRDDKFLGGFFNRKGEINHGDDIISEVSKRGEGRKNSKLPMLKVERVRGGNIRGKL